MRSLIFLPLFLLTLSASAQQLTGKPDTLLKVTMDRYSLSYPGSWSIDTSKMMGMEIILRSPRTDSLDDFSENMTVFVQDLHGQNYTLAKMGQESTAQVKDVITDVEVMESRLDSTASPNYYILTYKGRQGKFSLITIQRYYLKDEVGFALTFTVKIGEEAAYRSAAEKIFSSFQLH